MKEAYNLEDDIQNSNSNEHSFNLSEINKKDDLLSYLVGSPSDEYFKFSVRGNKIAEDVEVDEELKQKLEYINQVKEY